MCVSIDHAEFAGKKGTVVIFGMAYHPIHRRNVHVLAYQNAPKNLAGGPNAMMLHFPARPMTPENLVPTDNAPNIAADCVRAVQPVMRGSERSLSIGRQGVFVFDSGIYTVVLAQSPRDIPAALALVPRNKRPAVNTQLFDWYASFRTNWPIALCCFDSREAADATPLLFWYDPLDPNTGFLPALDAHDGRPPRLEDRMLVDVNHWVIFGMNDPQGTMQGRNRLNRVIYQDPLTNLQRALLPTHVVGRQFTGKEKNGDWLMPIQAIGDSNVNAIKRGILPA